MPANPGRPLPAARRKPGRPAHEPTEQSRETVRALVAQGRSVPDIALALTISAPTLRAHYRRELHEARAQKSIPLPDFDDPAPPRPAPAGSGRLPHVPTDETRERVAILLGAGMPAWQVAQAIGIAESTLRDHYAAELDSGRAAKRAELIVAMHTAGRGGNVAAQKAYLAMDSDLDAPPEPRPDPLGKKDAANQAALTAGAGVDWARGLPH